MRGYVVTRMGTRINALFGHNLAEYRNRDATLSRLAASLPAALAVEDYWRTHDPYYSRQLLDHWRADSGSPEESVLLHYTAPGSLFLTVTQNAAKIRTGGRWNGFMEIAPLRSVHLTALTKTANSLGADTFALFPDSGEVNDLFWRNGTYWDCMVLLEQMWGSPKRNIDDIGSTADIFRVWILDAT